MYYEYTLFFMCITNAETKLHSCMKDEGEPRNSKGLIMRGRVGIQMDVNPRIVFVKSNAILWAPNQLRLTRNFILSQFFSLQNYTCHTFISNCLLLESWILRDYLKWEIDRKQFVFKILIHDKFLVIIKFIFLCQKLYVSHSYQFASSSRILNFTREILKWEIDRK